MKRITRITALALVAGSVLAGCDGTSQAGSTASPAQKPRAIPGDTLRTLPPSAAKLLEPKNPEFAKGLGNMADRHKAQGRYAEAEPLYRRALAIMENAAPPVPYNLSTTLLSHADLLRKTGRADEAAEMEARARAIRAAHAESGGEGAK